MNELDQLTRFRDAVPAVVTPRAEALFRAGLPGDPHAERSVPPRRTSPLAWARAGWRLSVAVSVAAALAAGILVAVQPSRGGLTVQLLADRASAAALAQPMVSPGQWVYRVTEWYRPDPPKGVPATVTGADWETADGIAFYGGHSQTGAGDGDFPSYSQLGSLPPGPAALDAYLERTGGEAHAAQDLQVMSAFSQIEGMLTNYVLPPALEAEMYQALAGLPGIQVDSHVTVIDGRAGVAFVLPPTSQSIELGLILNPSTYAFLAEAAGLDGRWSVEQAAVRTVIVGAPGSTTPSRTPPTAAERLAEQADQAVDNLDPAIRPLTIFPSDVGPGRWVLRELATSSGDRTVWATADDSEQASYVHGKLQVCVRSAACARSTQWLMPAGESYLLADPPGKPLILPLSLSKLLAELNSYATGCADVAGDCNAVNAIANMSTGYAAPLEAEHSWFLVLADIPGVTVEHVTDVTGQADIAFRFPFTDGISEILFNASTYELVGYVRSGIETVMTRQVVVTGPGSLTACSADCPRLPLSAGPAGRWPAPNGLACQRAIPRCAATQVRGRP